MTLGYAQEEIVTSDKLHDILDEALAQLEAATTLEELQPVLKALIIAQKYSLNPPGYLGM